MNKHFTIIIPAYNCEKWVESNLNSAALQKYDNFDVVYVDDCSTDNTLKIAQSIQRQIPNKIKIVSNNVNKKALCNLYEQISVSKEGTIIVTLDGDDLFPSSEILTYLNEVYNKLNCWMTVGSYVQNDNYQVVSPYVPDGYWNQNIRKLPWSFSHLRTFRRDLFLKINKEDLIDDDGHFYRCTFDRAMMYPMVEMCGKEKVGLINKVMYVYNRHNPLSVDRVDRVNQLRIESKICNMSPYQKIQKL